MMRVLCWAAQGQQRLSKQVEPLGQSEEEEQEVEQAEKDYIIIRKVIYL